jgi:hypothetical protein
MTVNELIAEKIKSLESRKAHIENAGCFLTCSAMIEGRTDVIAATPELKTELIYKIDKEIQELEGLIKVETC